MPNQTTSRCAGDAMLNERLGQWSHETTAIDAADAQVSMMSDAQQRPEPSRNLGADDHQLSSTASSSRPVWSTWRDIPKVCLYPPHLVRTISIALIVGSVLFVINQLDVVLRGDATTLVWLKSALTYVVPFVVSNLGVLVATRADKSPS